VSLDKGIMRQSVHEDAGDDIAALAFIIAFPPSPLFFH
jgi:hypothetical protein